MICTEDCVPQEHLLRKIDAAMDFNKIYDFVEKLYCADNGRRSIDPVVLFKMVLIQHLYGLPSLRRTADEVSVNMAYRWFLGYGLNETTPHFSTVSYNFRHRFTAETIDKIFNWILDEIAQAGYLKPEAVFIDGTHIKANANTKKQIKEEVPVAAKRYAVETDCAEVKPEYISAFKDYGIKPSMLRFGLGGNAKAAFGPYDKRGYNSAGKKYIFGVAEFIKANLKVSNDMKFVFVFTSDTCKPEDAADLVRFLTLNPNDENAVGSNGVNYAAERVKLGLDKPVDIECFEIGNELDMQYYGRDDDGFSEGADEYINWADSMITAIKSANPSAKTSVHSYTVPHDSNTGYRYKIWNAKVIGALGEKADYVVLHYYYHYGTGFSSEMNENLINTELLTYINRIDEDKRPKIYVSEHAIWGPINDEAKNSQDIYKVTSLQGTLTTAEVINRLVKNPDVEMATYHSLFGSVSTETDFGGNCWGVFRPYFDNRVILTAVGEYYKMASNAFGGSSVSVTCDDGAKQGLTVSAHKDGNRLNLIFVNRSQTDNYNISFVDNGGRYKLEKKVVLTSDNMLDENLPSNPDKVYARTRKGTSDGEFLSYTVEAKSIKAVYLVPIDKETNNSDLSVTINGRNAENTPVVGDELTLEADLYENMPSKDAESMLVVISRKDNPENIVYLNSVEVLRRRACFDITMPDNAEGGEYTAFIGNRTD